ncbi:MAG: Maf family protein [Aeromonas sp.]
MSHVVSPLTAPALYLASASPRRRELLTQLGYAFSVRVGEVPEVRAPGEVPATYVRRLAEAKARAGQQLVADPHALVLGADTIVVLGEQVFEKPRDSSDAHAMLRQLSNCTHQVMTAVALVQGAQCTRACVVSEVTFRALTDAEITAYWHSGEPCDKAGSYAIQGQGGKFVRHLSGSYSAVVGLPLLETDALLSAALARSR